MSEEKKDTSKDTQAFSFLLEQFADIRIMRYQVPGFEKLSLRQKKLIYFLSEAALSGRDIIFDQHCKYNLLIRESLEEVYLNYQGNRTTPEFSDFEIYLKRIWFSNGIHHHYSTDKFFPECSEFYLQSLMLATKEANYPKEEQESIEDFINRLTQIIYNPKISPKRLDQTAGTDLVKASAVNFYEGISQEEVESYYLAQRKDEDLTPISYGLNSKLIKKDGIISELKYKEDGLYKEAIKEILIWLKEAVEVAENETQKSYIKLLIEFYKTASLKIWDECSIAWVKDLESQVDFVNGFIENYADPLGMKATYESIVNFKDYKASKRSDLLSQNAQWFEDNSPIDIRFKKKKVKGVSSKVIIAAMLAGDCYPSTPIGINLPNPDWIRALHGSKSVTIENITYAYDQASLGNGFSEEFCLNSEEVELERKYSFVADNLHTDMHECLGHGSGKILDGVSTDILKNYASPLEEARADLFALYYMMDPKMLELGILPHIDAAKIAYAGYIRNGLLTQLTRIELGKDVEQAHMRCRKLISEWTYEKGKDDGVIEKIIKNDKTYFRVCDYEKLRTLFGNLLAEIQRIKSEGDFEAGKKLVETYSVKIDPLLHSEVKARFKKLNLAPYGGFINPSFKPIFKNEKIVDIQLLYNDDFTKQSLEYTQKYSFLPSHS